MLRLIQSHKHLYTPKARNATYISPRSQHDIINDIGYDYNLSDIVAGVKTTKHFSVLADEVSSMLSTYLFASALYQTSNTNIEEGCYLTDVNLFP